jgi:outer membrane receptor protein involved in Fe transport
LYYPYENLAISSGLRFDKISSQYHSAETAESHDETAVTPKLAISLNLNRIFSVYGSVAAAFKAPTLVHLYDSPPIYFEFGPDMGQFFNISNAELKAQTGTCYEAGVKFLDSTLVSGRLSVYDYEISNEIDFDLSASRYMNIGQSRHLGIEMVTTYRPFPYLSGDFNLDYTASIIRDGEFYGNQINGVPLIEYRWQITGIKPGYGSVSIFSEGRGHQYLDQDNQRKLGEYHIFGFSAGTTLWETNIDFTVNNIFEREYCFDGYVGLFNESRFYPAPGRIFKISVSKQL